MTTPELIKQLNEIKQEFQKSANWAGLPTPLRDDARHKAKTIAAAIRLLAGTKRRQA